ncbi:orexin/Hypocretin receptor type 1-like [Glandiceps talaboti]
MVDVFELLTVRNGTVQSASELYAVASSQCLPLDIISAIVIIIGIPGNGLVLCVYWTKRQQSSANFYIWGLGIVDFLVCTVLLPHELYWCHNYYAYSSNLSCKIFKTILIMNVSISGLFLVAIAIDRYNAICRPLKFANTVRRAKGTTVGVIVTALLSSLPATVLYEVKTFDSTNDGSRLAVCDRHVSTTYSVSYDIFCAIMVVLVLVLLVVLYYFVGRTVIKRNTRIQNLSNGHGNHQPGAWKIMLDMPTYTDQGTTTCHENKASQLGEQQKQNSVNITDGNSGFRVPNNSEQTRAENYVKQEHATSRPGVAGDATAESDQRGINRQAWSNIAQKRSPPRALGTVKMLVSVTSIFLLTWIPWVIVSLIRTTGLIHDGDTTWLSVSYILYILLYINHGVNPIIYGIVSKKFRKDSKQALRTCYRL